MNRKESTLRKMNDEELCRRFPGCSLSPRTLRQVVKELEEKMQRETPDSSSPPPESPASWVDVPPNDQPSELALDSTTPSQTSKSDRTNGASEDQKEEKKVSFEPIPYSDLMIAEHLVQLRPLLIQELGVDTFFMPSQKEPGFYQVVDSLLEKTNPRKMTGPRALKTGMAYFSLASLFFYWLPSTVRSELVKEASDFENTFGYNLGYLFGHPSSVVPVLAWDGISLEVNRFTPITERLARDLVPLSTEMDFDFSIGGSPEGRITIDVAYQSERWRRLVTIEPKMRAVRVEEKGQEELQSNDTPNPPAVKQSKENQNDSKEEEFKLEELRFTPILYTKGVVTRHLNKLDEVFRKLYPKLQWKRGKEPFTEWWRRLVTTTLPTGDPAVEFHSEKDGNNSNLHYALHFSIAGLFLYQLSKYEPGRMASLQKLARILWSERRLSVGYLIGLEMPPFPPGFHGYDFTIDARSEIRIELEQFLDTYSYELETSSHELLETHLKEKFYIFRAVLILLKESEYESASCISKQLGVKNLLHFKEDVDTVPTNLMTEKLVVTLCPLDGGEMFVLIW